MFTDRRGKRVIFIAHCLLNQNAISDGTADFPGSNAQMIQALLREQVGIVQLPCPELCCLGLDRGNEKGAESPVVVENTRIRKAMQSPAAAKKLAALVEQVLYQVSQYHQHGFAVLGLVGVDRSPCCGVSTTSAGNREVEGQGVFVEALRAAFSAAHIPVPVIGVKPGEAGAKAVAALL